MSEYSEADDRNERELERRERLGLVECEQCGRVVDSDKAVECHACKETLCDECAINVEPENGPDYWTCGDCCDAADYAASHPGLDGAFDAARALRETP